MKAMLLTIVALGVAASPLQDGLPKRLTDAYVRAADWLVSQQDASGAWKQGPPDQAQPSLAYTGLIVAALAPELPGSIRSRYKDAVDKGVAYLISKQNSDGSFGEGPGNAFLKVYTTSIALMAISLAAPDQKDAIGNARGYLKSNQLKEGPDKGSLGYGDKEMKIDQGKPVEKPMIPNLSTTGFAA